MFQSVDNSCALPCDNSCALGSGNSCALPCVAELSSVPFRNSCCNVLAPNCDIDKFSGVMSARAEGGHMGVCMATSGSRNTVFVCRGMLGSIDTVFVCRGTLGSCDTVFVCRGTSRSSDTVFICNPGGADKEGPGRVKLVSVTGVTLFGSCRTKAISEAEVTVEEAEVAVEVTGVAVEVTGVAVEVTGVRRRKRPKLLVEMGAGNCERTVPPTTL